MSYIKYIEGIYKRFRENKEFSAYINSPSERNAYFMTWLENILSELSTNDRCNYFTPKEKIEFLKSQISNNPKLIAYYNSLTNKNKKRFISRLYKYLESDYDFECKTQEERNKEFFDYIFSV